MRIDGRVKLALGVAQVDVAFKETYGMVFPKPMRKVSRSSTGSVSKPKSLARV